VLSVGGGASEHFDSDAECLRAFEAAAGEFGEPEAAAEHLERRGYGRVAMSATFPRPAGQPGFSAPPGIEVELLEGDSMVETFSNVLAPAYHLDRNGDGFIFGLPGRREWRTYLAADENGPIAAAAMMMHVGRPQLAFAGSLPGCRRRGGHMALLHRQTRRAERAGAPGLRPRVDHRWLRPRRRSRLSSTSSMVRPTAKATTTTACTPASECRRSHPPPNKIRLKTPREM